MLQEAHEYVWKFRKKYAKYWPTPGRDDSIRYAFTEAGEALSDWLRESRQDHKRNHLRAPNVHGELADCAIMLFTALPECHQFTVTECLECNDNNMDAICTQVGTILNNIYQPDAVVAALVETALADIQEYVGGDFYVLIMERLAAIFARHVAPNL